MAGRPSQGRPGGLDRGPGLGRGGWPGPSQRVQQGGRQLAGMVEAGGVAFQAGPGYGAFQQE